MITSRLPTQIRAAYISRVPNYGLIFATRAFTLDDFFQEAPCHPLIFVLGVLVEHYQTDYEPHLACTGRGSIWTREVFENT